MSKWWDKYHGQAEFAFGLMGLVVLGVIFDPSLIVAVLILFGVGYSIYRIFFGEGPTQYETESSQEHSPVRAMKRPRWGKDVMGKLTPRQFRMVVAGYFHARGYHSKFLPETSSSDVDIYLFKNADAPRPLGVIQCQAGVKSVVGIARVRKLGNVMRDENIPLGISATAGQFSSEATRYLKGHRIQALQGDKLELLLSNLTATEQTQIFSMLIEELQDAPICPSCGTGMHRMDLVSQGKHHFWACNNYPQCRQTLETG